MALFKGTVFDGSSGLVLAEGPDLLAPFALGEDESGWPKVPKEPKEPDNRFEKLPLRLCVADELLDTVDCDHRFRFPTPSFTPILLSGRLLTALDRLRGSGDKDWMDRFAGLMLISFGLCDLKPDALGRDPLRDDVARCTVTTEDDEAEFDLVD